MVDYQDLFSGGSNDDADDTQGTGSGDTQGRHIAAKEAYQLVLRDTDSNGDSADEIRLDFQDSSRVTLSFFDASESSETPILEFDLNEPGASVFGPINGVDVTQVRQALDTVKQNLDSLGGADVAVDPTNLTHASAENVKDVLAELDSAIGSGGSGGDGAAQTVLFSFGLKYWAYNPGTGKYGYDRSGGSASFSTSPDQFNEVASLSMDTIDTPTLMLDNNGSVERHTVKTLGDSDVANTLEYGYSPDDPVIQTTWHAGGVVYVDLSGDEGVIKVTHRIDGAKTQFFTQGDGPGNGVAANVPDAPPWTQSSPRTVIIGIIDARGRPQIYGENLTWWHAENPGETNPHGTRWEDVFNRESRNAITLQDVDGVSAYLAGLRNAKTADEGLILWLLNNYKQDAPASKQIGGTMLEQSQHNKDNDPGADLYWRATDGTLLQLKAEPDGNGGYQLSLSPTDKTFDQF